jgi:sugar-specific transcriptional regulator TrmB/DNA-binding CsgD family transcriptional regulator
MLEAAGLRPDEELVYRALLAAGRATAAEVAAAAGLTSTQVITSMSRLRSRGLVTRETGRPPAYLAVPPVIAIEALVIKEEEELHRRSEELARLRLAAAELARQVGNPARGASPEFVEVLQGRDALGDRFTALQRAAREEVFGFDKPPYVVGRTPDTMANSVELERLQQGVRYRILYDRTALETPGMLERIDGFRAAGEEARVHPHVPMKLAIADRKLGLIPLNLTDPTAASGLIIHESSLLQALVMFFETMWERAQPMDLPAGSADATAADPLNSQDRRLLLLLATGLKDEAIARQLGLGNRTVLRHVAALLAKLEARTRFQAGAKAAQRGWL